VAMAPRPGLAAYVPLGHRYLGAPAQLSVRDVVDVLGPILADPAVQKIAHDSKFAEVVLSRHGMTLEGVVADTMLASYLLDPEAPNAVEIVADRDANVKLEPLELSGARKRGQGPTATDEYEVEEATRHLARYPEALLGLTERHAARLQG